MPSAGALGAVHEPFLNVDACNLPFLPLHQPSSDFSIPKIACRSSFYVRKLVLCVPEHAMDVRSSQKIFGPGNLANGSTGSYGWFIR